MVELLLVAAIISLLLGLLLPSVSRSARAAAKAACLSQMRQVTIALNLYAGDHADEFPANYDGMGSHLAPNWVAGNMRIPAEAHDKAILTAKGRTLLAPYVTLADLYKCPGDDSRFARTLSMNCRINPKRLDGMARWVRTSGAIFRKQGDLRNPSTTFALTDEASESINDAYFAIDLSNTRNPDAAAIERSGRVQIIDRPGVFHDGLSIMSFADGHAEAHRWKNPAIFALEDIIYLQSVCLPNQ